MKTSLLSFILGILSINEFLFTPGETVPGAEVSLEMGTLKKVK